MPAPLHCTGAVLVGGKSVRMGSPKHLQPLPDGRTMLERVRAALAPICTRIVIVDAHSPNIATNEQDVIRDLRPNTGPLGAIEALLASRLDSLYLICPCDVPLINSDLLRLLLHEPQKLASVFHIEGRTELEPLPARIRAEALPVARRLLNAQQRSVWKLMKELQPHVVTITEAQAVALHNVNTANEYEEALRLMNANAPQADTHM